MATENSLPRMKRELSLTASSNEDVNYLSAPNLVFRNTRSCKDVDIKDNAQPKKYVPNEEKHSWIVLTSVLCYNTIQGYHYLCFGFYYAIFSEIFGTSKAVTGLIGSINRGVVAVCSLFASVFIEMYGSRCVALVGILIAFVGIFTSAFASNVYILFVTYGALTGIGLSMSGLSSSVIIQQHFNKHRNLATSIAMCGTPIGSIISPFITNYLLNTFGWRGTLILQSGIFLQTLAFALTFTPPYITGTPKIEHQNSVKFVRSLMDFSLFKDFVFVPFAFALMCFIFNIEAFFNHLPSRIVYFGGDLQFAGYLMTIMWIAGLACRLACTVISAFDMLYPLVGMIGVQLSQGICAVVLPFCTTKVSLIFVTGIFGCAQGFMAPCVILSLVKVFGVSKYARSRAMTDVVGAVGTFAATPLTGWMFDVTANYDIPFYFSGAVGLLGGCLSVLVAIIYIIRKKENMTENAEPEGCNDKWLGEETNHTRFNTI